MLRKMKCYYLCTNINQGTAIETQMMPKKTLKFTSRLLANFSSLHCVSLRLRLYCTAIIIFNLFLFFVFYSSHNIWIIYFLDFLSAPTMLDLETWSLF